VQWQLGLGRERVLSAEGLADAAYRWQRGEDGPDSQIARLADHRCSTCAWLLPIGGTLGQAFGVCAHDMSPSDGHIVAMDHGCGAHSDAVAEPSHVPVTELIIDENTFLELEVRDTEAVGADIEAPADDVEESADDAADVSADDAADVSADDAADSSAD
jgi:hypothetical protein